MSLTRIIGIVIVVIGVLLLIFGLSAAESPVEQVTETLIGRYTRQTMLYIIGGVAAIIGGSLLALFGKRP